MVSFFVKYTVGMLISMRLVDYYLDKKWANIDYRNYGGSTRSSTQRSGNVRDPGRPKGSA